MNEWQEGDPAPPGYIECDGHRGDGTEGRHIRRIDDRSHGGAITGGTAMRNPQHRPETRDGEEVVYSIGSPRPVIVATGRGLG